MAKKKIDFDKHFTGDKPIPPGTVILTEAEKKAIQEAGGMKEGAPPTTEEIKSQLDRMWQKEEEEYLKKVDEAVKKKKQISFEEIPDISEIPADKAKSVLEIIEKAKKFAIEDKKEEVKPESPKPKADSPEPESSPPNTESIAGAIPTKTHCQHCGWNLSIEDAAPSSRDMYLFTMAELAGTPFQKEFEAFGGKLKMVFRTVGVKNSEMALRQTGYDMTAAGIRTQEEFFVALFNYRLVCSLKKVTIGETEQEIGDSVDEYLRTHKEILGKSTPLPRILEVVQELSPLNREAVWRVIGESFKKFNQLVSSIEARADDPDFAKAIAEFH